MSLYNFRTASVLDRADREQRIADLDASIMRVLEASKKEGIDRFALDKEYRMKASKVLRDSIIDEFSDTDPTPIFTERREGELGAVYEFESPVNTFRVVEYSPRAHPTVFTPAKRKYTIRTESFELPIGVPIQQLLNRTRSIPDIIEHAAQAITRHYVDLVLTAVNTACSAGSTDPRGHSLRTLAAGSDVTKEEIDGALRRMYASSSGATIYGTRYALDPIFDAAAQTGGDITKEELVKRGVIGRYRGANLVAIESEHNIYYQRHAEIAGIDLDNLIFIAAGRPGAVLLERSLSGIGEWESYDPRLAEWSMGIRIDHGILVTHPHYYHVIQLTN